MISDNYEFAKDSAAGNGSCNQGEIVARQARMTFGANAVRRLLSVDDVLRRRRSICSCPSAQVFNLIIGLSIFFAKRPKERSATAAAGAAKLKQLNCSSAAQAARSFRRLSRGNFQKHSISCSGVDTPPRPSASVLLPHPPLISGILRACRPVLSWSGPGLVDFDLLLVFATLLLGLAYFAY